jgi:hypothetical protein
MGPQRIQHHTRRSKTTKKQTYMKKHTVTLFALAALAAAGCTKEEWPERPESGQWMAAD